MFYGIDENGRIVGSESSDVLPDSMRSLYPAHYDDIEPLVSTQDTEMFLSDEAFEIQSTTVSSGDSSLYYNDVLATAIEQAIANSVLYDIYPSAQAVEVFTDVLGGIDNDVYYYAYAGSDSNTAFLYYSTDCEISGKTLTLSGRVTECSYYRYRPGNTGTWLYRYSVQEDVGPQTITLGTSLVYTNMYDGYPDILPSSGFTSVGVRMAFIGVSALLVLLAWKGGSRKDV